MRHRWWLMSIVLLLIAAACVTWGVRGNRAALAGPASPPDPAAATRSGAETARPTGVGDPTPATTSGDGLPVEAPRPGAGTGLSATSQALPSPPVTLRIPTIAVSTSLSELGLNPDRTVQVPTDFQQPGWFKLGPTPGQMGSAVILGHVDSYQGPAVFYRLRSLQEGDPVEVGLTDGRVAEFVVTAVATYLKSDFPAEAVYAPHGFSALQLVTCGGRFDTQTRSYLSNVVVYTSLSKII